ncbi:oligopeptide transporter, OPT family [candidate division KSB1 bacterium]|nr:oligopeptide transporter, OPT family [candidate division KSB1 bacterium]
MDGQEYEGTSPVAEFKPYISVEQKLRDFSFRAICTGIIFGIVFGSANAYLGLRVGLTISTAIPLAIVAVAIFKLLSPVLGPSNVLEQNIAATTGSASSSLASGIIFTIPALFIWGFNPPLLQIGTLALLGGVLGVLFMIPLRRFLIVKEHGSLPYPEGTAAAQVLIAADVGGARANNVFLGLGVGALYKFFTGFVKLWPESLHVRLPVLKKAELGLEAGPALLGVGYILGYRISAIMVAGGLLSWIGIIPIISYFGEGLGNPLAPANELLFNMTPYDIWSSYIKYIGAGAVACAGIITVFKSIPTMYKSLKIGIQGIRRKSNAEFIRPVRTDHDVSIHVVLIGVMLVMLGVVITPHVLGIGSSLMIRIVGALCIAVFAFMFVTVSSRIVGLVGVSSNPTSGMTIVTLLGTSLVFAALGWTDDFGKAAALTVGTVVCIASSIAGDISQDLKAGYIIGATPQKQQTAELIGVMTSAFGIAAAVWLLGRVYEFGSADLAAPQATLMKTVIEGVLHGNLQWSLVLSGVALALTAELLGVPSLPFAVGIYLPLATMTPVFMGGVIRHFVEKSSRSSEERESRKERGILLGSGLIAGEGIIGVLVAAYAFFSGKPEGLDIKWPGIGGEIISLLIFVLLGVFLISRSCGKRL